MFFNESISFIYTSSSKQKVICCIIGFYALNILSQQIFQDLKQKQSLPLNVVFFVLFDWILDMTLAPWNCNAGNAEFGFKKFLSEPFSSYSQVSFYLDESKAELNCTYLDFILFS